MKTVTKRCPRIGPLQLAAVALLASAATGAHASQQNRYSPVEIEVISDYRGAFAQYPLHTGATDGEFRAYLEAAPGKNYSIRVRNHTGDRVGLVIAVDGRNIVSGKKSRLRPGERMYVLGPYQSTTYRGWRTASDRVNRFYFTEAQDSYAEAFDDRSAMGVIAVAAFREKFYRQHGNLEKDSRAAPASPSQKSGSMADAAPGTGFGDNRYSPSRRVQFEPERHAMNQVFLKYEWRSMLCRKGIVECDSNADNRFWPRSYDNNGYAPAPYSGALYRAPRPRGGPHYRSGY